VYSNTASNYSGTSTRLSMSTDASAVSLLPGLTGTYRTTFDAPGSAAKYIEIRIVRVANASALVASDFIVGPGVVTQGAAVGPWTTSVVPAGGWFVTGPTNVTTVVSEKREGQDLLVTYAITATGTSASFTPMEVKLPGTYAIDTTVLPYSATQLTELGRGQLFKSGVNGASVFAVNSGTSTTSFVVYYLDPTSTLDVRGSITQASPVNWTTTTGNTQLTFTIRVPVSIWAGSGTVNVVQNDQEWASNSSTNDAPDTTSFAYGPSGSQFINITAARAKTVQFQTPIQQGDRLTLEVTKDSGATWHDIAEINGTSSFQSYTYQGVANDYGMAIQPVSATQVIVYFGKYRLLAASATYGANGTDWSGVAASATNKWRVRKVSGGQAVGFSEVVPGTSAGLVGAAGLKGNAVTVQTANSYPTGVFGEYLERNATGNTSITSSTVMDVDATGITLTPGTWDISGVITFTSGATTSISLLSSWIGTASGTSATGKDVNRNYAQFNYVTTGTVIGGQFQTLTLPVWRVSISANTPYYLKTNCTFTVSTLTANGTVRATRVM
jgi:hypothetical protein